MKVKIEKLDNGYVLTHNNTGSYYSSFVRLLFELCRIFAENIVLMDQHSLEEAVEEMEGENDQ